MTNGSKSFLGSGQKPTHMVCPNCQLRQPLALDCVGCGAIIDRLEDAMVPASPSPAAPKAAAPRPSVPSPAASKSSAPPPAAAPRAESPAAAKPLLADDPSADPADLDFIPLKQDRSALAPAPPPVPVPGAGREPARRETESFAAAAADGVYQGKNPFAEDGAHSRFGTRGPTDSYRDGQFLAEEVSAFTILGEAFSLFGRNLVGFTIIAGVAMLPAIIFSLHTASEIAGYSLETGAEPTMADIKRILVLLGLNVLFSFLCMPIATAAVTYGVGRELRKQTTTMIDCVQAGVKVLVPVLGVTVVQSLIVGIFGAVVFVIAFFALAPVVVALPCLGIIGFFIPLLLVAAFAASFAVTIPATVEERPGVLGALRTSWELTDGARLTIAFFYFALGFVGVMITLVLGFLGGLVNDEAAELAAQVAQVVVTALNAAGVAVFYFRLRSAAERVPIAELSSVA